MNLRVYTLEGKEAGSIELPDTLLADYRPDLIQRAVLAIQSLLRMPYGAKPDAGKRHSAKLSRRRRDYRGSYGYGISRVPRKIHTRRGRQMYWVGAFAPGTVGGRRAHPPRAEKNWVERINVKEKRLAVRSALAASLDITRVRERGHIPPERYPFAVEGAFEQLAKTRDVRETLVKLGFADELARAEERRIRAGRGKMRGRRYKVKKSLLIIVKDPARVKKAAENLPGVEVVRYDHVNAKRLAPGAHPGRIILLTAPAIEALRETPLAR